jgi:hypothetical protein
MKFPLRLFLTAHINHHRFQYCFYLSILISLFLVSCSSQKRVLKSPIREEGADFLIEKLKTSELKYDWFTAKFSAEYRNNGQTNSFNGQIRICRDSLIWLSFSPILGIEVFRMIISQDSVKFINRMNNTYFIGDYEYVNNFLHSNIDFDILQSFLIGNDLSLYENGSFRASIDNNIYKLATAERRKLKKYVRNSQEKPRVLIQNIWIDPATFKIMKANVKEIQKPNMKLEANYSRFEDIGHQLFPKEMSFEIDADNEILVEVSFSKILIDAPQPFPFRIPSGYRQVK